MTHLLLNGDFIEHNNSLFVQDTRLWQFGEGLFESIRVVNNSVPLMDLHTKRLHRSAKILGWPISPSWNDEFWKREINKFCKKNNLINARIKILVYRQGAGAYNPENSFFNWIITGSKLEISKYELNKTGLRTIEYSLLPKSEDFLSLIKTTSAIRYVQAARYAKQNGVDEVLITNQSGRICEASSSNLFLVHGKTLITPSLSEYCLDGVMRKKIIEIATKNNIECIETAVLKDDIIYADEVFLTNSIKGIQWVASFEDVRYELGSTTKKLFLLISETLN